MSDKPTPLEREESARRLVIFIVGIAVGALVVFTLVNSDED